MVGRLVEGSEALLTWYDSVGVLIRDPLCDETLLSLHKSCRVLYEYSDYWLTLYSVADSLQSCKLQGMYI